MIFFRTVFYFITFALPVQLFSASTQVDVLYNSEADIYGFQFNVNSATVTSASGGAAADAGFTVSTGGGEVVLGFSFTGSFIPAGSGILTTLEVEGDDACLSDLVLSGEGGVGLDAAIEDCLTIFYEAPCGDSDADGICDEVDDCVGEYDECGVCNGDGIDEGACDCEGSVEDCAGECGGSTVLDECGECGGDGSSCQETTVDILYNSDTDIAGFQFYVENVDLISASGGEAEDNGFLVSVGNNTILGFSLTGSVIPAGSGVLTTLVVLGENACISDLILAGQDGGSLNAEVVDCIEINYIAPIPGCTDENACNYDENAGIDDGSCEFPEENYDCDGNCIAELDCTGECGGSTIVDECGVCGGTGIPTGECDCNSNVDDCAGICGGTAVEDDCGVCNGDGTSCMFVILSFGAVAESSVEILLENPIDVAGFQFNISGLNITGASGGTAEENAFMVSTSSNTVLGFSLSGNVIPIGNAVLTNLSFNSISGDDICLSNAVISSSSGDAINYELGICLNAADYFTGGCSNEEACNFDPDLDFDDGSCIYPEENFDCEGNCLLEYDCANVCGGNSELDECGECGGDGPAENFDCDGNCLVDIDCNGQCGGNAEYDACGTCGGDGSNCENPEATLSFGDLGGYVLLQVSYIDPVGDVCIANPVLSDPQGNGVQTLLGACTTLNESSGVLDMYLNSAVDISGFQYNLTGITITGASGGLAGDAGFTISTSANIILGFSFSGDIIGANGSVGCMDESACNYNDEATISGTCYYDSDCAGECGGNAIEDECGICNGPDADVECWDGELVCDPVDCSDEPVYEDVDYLTEIQPIFNANCTSYCHTDGGSYQAGLDLTSYENLMAGDSDHGPVIISGDSENSLLIQKLSMEIPPVGVQMPQGGPYLDPSTIALIAAWIDEGALPSEGGGDDGGNEIVEGCTDPNANNFDPDATDDDGSCTYDPLGELTFGNIDYDNGTLEINLDCQYAVSSFVFDLSGINITGYYGGTTEVADFEISIEGSTVSGNATEDNIPANSGLLMIVTFDEMTEQEICFSNSNITTFVGIEYEAILDDCIIIDSADGCEESEFECGDGNCINGSWECDGWIDCEDGSDEADCEDGGGTTGGDDGGGEGCDTGYVDDCSGDGDCCPESWIGDGSNCDGEDQPYGCDLSCYDNDGGDCETDLSIDLIEGWNWISFNVDPEDATLSSVLASVSETATFINSQSSGTATNYGEYGWYGGLAELDPTQMYLLLMSEAATLTITGVPVDVASSPIDLIAGFNWIGYLPQNAGSVGEAFASVSETASFVNSQSSGTATNYGEYGWYGGLATLEPGSGYLLLMNEEDQLVYPEFSGLARLGENKQEVVLRDAISDWDFNYSDYEFIGTIHTSIENREDLDGDIVGVFVDGKCRGIAERMYFPFDDSHLYIIQVYSNISDGEEMTFKYFDSESGEVVEYAETMIFTSNMVVGDGFNTFALSREVGDLQQPMTYGISDAYPNPFNPVTSFNYSLPEDGMVQVAIYDINGRMVSELVNGYQSAGTYPVVWDAQELSSGVYMVNMIAGDYSTIQKVMLIK